MPPAPYAQPMDQGSITTTRHSNKASNTKRTGASGILFTMRSGAAAYIEQGGPFALEYTPGIEDELEAIQCRMGDSFITIKGRCLYPLFEDLQSGRCDAIRESEHKLAVLGVPYIESITVRLCF
jgi:hypothetical protein